MRKNWKNSELPLRICLGVDVKVMGAGKERGTQNGTDEQGDRNKRGENNVAKLMNVGRRTEERRKEGEGRRGKKNEHSVNVRSEDLVTVWERRRKTLKKWDKNKKKYWWKMGSSGNGLNLYT